jgi:hypothetical protein
MLEAQMEVDTEIIATLGLGDAVVPKANPSDDPSVAPVCLCLVLGQ